MAPRLKGIFVALVFSVVCLIIARSVQSSKAASKPYGKLTSDQILARAESLAKSLDPHAPAIRLTALRSPDDASVRTWEVRCETADRKTTTNITWNADSGELYTIGRHQKRTDVPEGPTLDRKGAVRAAWDWLRAVGVSKMSKTWHVDEARQQERGTWSVKLRSENRMAFITVESKTRELCWLQTWRRQPGDESLQAGGLVQPKV